MASEQSKSLMREAIANLESTAKELQSSLEELLAFLETDERERRNSRRMQSDQFFLGRASKGLFATNFSDVYSDATRFRRYYRMNPSTFDYILQGIAPLLTKNSHRAIPPKERLWLTLRYVLL